MNLVDVLAAYRITRLVTDDTITEPVRDRLLEHVYRNDYWKDMAPPIQGWSEMARADEEPPRLAELLTCRWCAGFWVAAAVTAARRTAPDVWTPIADVFATGALVGFLSELSHR